MRPGRGASGFGLDLDLGLGSCWVEWEAGRSVKEGVGEGRGFVGFLEDEAWERELWEGLVVVSWGPRMSSTSTSMLSVASTIGLSTFFLGTLGGTKQSSSLVSPLVLCGIVGTHQL